MKKIKILAAIILTAVTASLPLAGKAQSTSVPNLLTNAPSSFFGTVGAYFTSSNPNLPIAGKAEIAIGTAYQSGIGLGADLDLRYKVYNVTTNSGIFVESDTRNAGIAGVIVSEQAGAGYFYIPASTPDIELSAGLLGGYRFDVEQPAFSAYLDVRKSLTVNTFAGTRLAYEYEGEDAPAAPVLTVWTGFTF